jgi:hypothetical protein
MPRDELEMASERTVSALRKSEPVFGLLTNGGLHLPGMRTSSSDSAINGSLRGNFLRVRAYSVREPQPLP